ncbi:hypothetical protein [Agromyces marinus]|uniref:hypothetical protein n=1 Tax=Agromyces marinus TaxID=1389020 RepID=UPI0025722CF8|nr:hypothetical protein [Agromyces marinus]
MIRRLRGFPEIIALHTTNGGWDLVAELRTATLGSSTACSVASARSTASSTARRACC